MLAFSATWKAFAQGEDSSDGFLNVDSHIGPPTMQQDCEGTVSWSHLQDNPEPDPEHEGWVLLHIGNIFVRDSGMPVSLSFGGNNPHWCTNLQVDFGAIAPLRLSGDIVLLVLAGNRKGQGYSPLSSVPGGVIDLILEFAQPTLVPPPDNGEGGVQEEGEEDDGCSRRWRVV